jgi:hypothetical protein
MKRRVLMVLVVLVVALSAQGCVAIRTVSGSGTVKEEERQVSDFTGVELATIGNLTIELGDKEALRIEAEDNLLRYFETQMRNGVLKIKDRHNVTLIPTKPVYFYLTVKELDTIVISGLGNVEVPDLKAARFSVNISGAGDVAIEDLDTDVLKVNISGGGDVDIEELDADRLEVGISGLGSLYIDEGEVEEQDITISSAGDYRAKGLESAEAEVRISGVGSATVRVRDHLKVTISGAGSVRYVGSPTVEQDVSGVGHVERIGD